MAYVGKLRSTCIADCPFSIAQAYAEEYLAEAERGGPAGMMFAGPFKRRVAVEFGRRVDATDPGRVHEELTVRWTARSRLIPDFSGNLRMRIVGTQTRLILKGEYRPPGGIFGVIFDNVIGKRIAHATAASLLARIAAALAEREAAWRRRVEDRLTS